MKTILLIDSGYLKNVFKNNGKFYDADGIEEISKHIISSIKAQGHPLDLLRILFYDCLPYSGEVILPVSKHKKQFSGKDCIMGNLALRDYFATRKGTLKFRGWTLKQSSYTKTALSDDDFEPSFEQKGVDMRIGLDISQYSYDRSVEHIILISNDTDCIPAMKCARKNGIKMSLVSIENAKIAPELKCHADFVYDVNFPKSSSKIKNFVAKKSA